ncbi:MAG: hypothetical protein LBB54_03505 [Cellulomonadaceae bacterium]|nr:hypothetical protein [Cellulomonadaceae bacterium]
MSATIVTCPAGHQVPAGVKFCTQCGQSVPAEPFHHGNTQVSPSAPSNPWTRKQKGILGAICVLGVALVAMVSVAVSGTAETGSAAGGWQEGDCLQLGLGSRDDLQVECDSSMQTQATILSVYSRSDIEKNGLFSLEDDCESRGSGLALATVSGSLLHDRARYFFDDYTSREAIEWHQSFISDKSDDGAVCYSINSAGIRVLDSLESEHRQKFHTRSVNSRIQHISTMSGNIRDLGNVTVRSICVIGPPGISSQQIEDAVYRIAEAATRRVSSFRELELLSGIVNEQVWFQCSDRHRPAMDAIFSAFHGNR